jgi:membrane protease YdiL (CAAX protease family)
MTIQAASMNLTDKEAKRPNWIQYLGLFLLFLICEAAIFIFGSSYFDIYPTNRNLTYNLVISAVFLTISLWFKYNKRWNKYWQIAFAFFIASTALPFTMLLEGWINAVLNWFAVTVDTSKGLAIVKVCEMLLKTLPLIALVKLSGADMPSIFLKRGNLKVGLGVGVLVFINFSTSALLFFTTRYTNLALLGNAIVWGLVFSFANGFMEELWLRGIFLKRFEPVLGINGSVWLTSIIFGLMHGMAYYFTPAVLPFFVINTLALGLGCGYLMMKSDSIWGATLIHAAADFFLFIAVLANA